ncbi:MAG: aldo/keto reductase [Pseudomonadota bacterium]
MHFLDTTIEPLGMGCWPIGGPMFSGKASIGYTDVDDAESVRTIHAALDGGIRLFDTAAAYGAGHSERLLGQALKHRPDALVVTKIGIAIDEESKRITFGDTDPARVAPAVEACLARLGRDRIDLVLLHDNKLPVAEAAPIFAALDALRQAGKIRAFGWSTDFSDSAAAVAGQEGFAAVEHAMNVFVDPPRIQQVVEDHGLTALIRSPLAMGLLTGAYGAETQVRQGDIRAGDSLVIPYFRDGRANPEFLARLDAVRALLTVGGRSLAQGAIGWLWAKGARNLPIPGARTVAQIEGLVGALTFGALPPSVMAEIDGLLANDRQHAFEQEL